VCPLYCAYLYWLSEFNCFCSFKLGFPLTTLKDLGNSNNKNNKQLLQTTTYGIPRARLGWILNCRKSFDIKFPAAVSWRSRLRRSSFVGAVNSLSGPKNHVGLCHVRKVLLTPKYLNTFNSFPSPVIYSLCFLRRTTGLVCQVLHGVRHPLWTRVFQSTTPALYHTTSPTKEGIDQFFRIPTSRRQG
jgi:hypothetical protein